MPEIEIRLAKTPDEYKACQLAQKAAWGITEDGFVVPVATMVGAQLHGGLLLGAYLPSGEAVGFSFAFLGKNEVGRLCFYSQLTGVVPAYQSHGIGGKLKDLQLKIARERGIELICWAFDPMQAGNAKFNLNKLGATANRFVVDMYGPRKDALNLGRPTDRLIAEWETNPDANLGNVTDQLEIEIPPSIIELQKSDRERADSWSLQVRSQFLEAFEAGFRAESFEKSDGPDGLRCYYRLRKRDALGSLHRGDA